MSPVYNFLWVLYTHIYSLLDGTNQTDIYEVNILIASEAGLPSTSTGTVMGLWTSLTYIITLQPLSGFLIFMYLVMLHLIYIYTLFQQLLQLLVLLRVSPRTRPRPRPASPAAMCAWRDRLRCAVSVCSLSVTSPASWRAVRSVRGELSHFETRRYWVYGRLHLC